MIKILRILPEKYQIDNYSYSQRVYEKVIKLLSKRLSVKRDDYDIIVRRMEKQNQKFVISEYRRFLNLRNLTFGVGFLRIVINLLEENGYEYKVFDYKNFIKKFKIDKKEFDRKYQYEALRTFFDKGGYGIVKIPTGSGKTRLVFQATEIYNQNKDSNGKVLYFVDSRQAIDRDIPEEADNFSLMKIQFLRSDLNFNLKKDLYITTIQSFIQVLKKAKKDSFMNRKLNEFLRLVKFLIIDESKSFCTNRRKFTLKLFKHAKIRLFLSAEPFKKGSKLSKYNAWEGQGRVVYEKSEEDLVKQGFLSERKVLFLSCYSQNVLSRFFGYGRAVINQIDNYIINDKQRNWLIIMVNQILMEFDLKVAYLVNRLEHGKKLRKCLKMPFIQGNDDMYIRGKVIDKLVKNNEPFIASGIFNKGVNVPQLQVFINAAGGKNEEMIIQRKGRVVRLDNKLNKKLYIDFYDYGNNKTEEHSLSRLNAMKRTVDKKYIKIISINDLKSEVIKFFGKEIILKTKKEIDSVSYESLG